MINSFLKWQIAAHLGLAMIFAGNFVYQELFEEETTTIGTSSSGTITAVTKIITAEQKQSYGRFLKTEVKNKVLRFITAGKIKGMLYFQWEALNSYGIEISPENPITWKRTLNAGEIEIVAPALVLIDSKILIDSDKYIILDINKSIGISEKRVKSEYRDIQVKTTVEDAKQLLLDDLLINTARSVIAEHIKQILNQGLTTEKIHAATVTFRS